MALGFQFIDVPAPAQEFLAGAQAGRRFGQRLLARGRLFDRPSVLVLDFSKAPIATGSWLREAILRVK